MSENRTGVVTFDETGMNKPTKRQKQSKRTAINAAVILDDLDDLRKANLKDALDEQGRYRPLKEWPDALLRLVVGIELEQKCRREGDTWVPAAQVLRVRFSDRLRILELAGKHKAIQAFDAEQHVHLDGIAFEERFREGIERARLAGKEEKVN